MVTFRNYALICALSWLWTLATLTSGQQVTLHVGAVLGTGDAPAEQALRQSFSDISGSGEGPVNLQLHVENTEVKDGYLVSQALSNLMRNGSISTLVVPSLTPLVSWWASRFDMPLVSLRSSSLPTGVPKVSIEVSPDPTLALIDVMRFYKWSSLHYFYQDDEGLQRLQTLQQVGSGVLNMSSWFLHRVEDSHTARTILRRLDVIQNSGRIYVALDLEPDLAWQVLSEVARANYLEKKNFHFLLFQPADDSLWNSPFLNELQVSGIRLYVPKSVPQGLRTDEQRNSYGSTTQWLLARDAARVLSEAVGRLARNDPLVLQQLQASVKEDQPLAHGTTLTNYLRETYFNGGSTPGAIQFDSSGKRRAFVLDILEATSQGPTKAFSWSDANGLTVMTPSYIQRGPTLSSKTYIVTSILNEPYLMLKKNADDLTGNDKYEGYVKDLLLELAQKLGFKFELTIVKDGRYGMRNPNGQWNGMIGEVANHEADMAVSDITVTNKREEVVDMSTPFMMVGISLMVTRPTDTGSSPASTAYFFLSPFAAEVWGCLLVALLVVGVAHYAIGRLMSRADSQGLSTPSSSSFLDSLWFAFGSLFLRQTGLHPKSFSNRVLSGVWWVFAFFVLALYLTSLVSILVSSEMGVRGLSREEALAQKSAVEIIQESVETGFPEIGFNKGGSTNAFFEESRDELYKQLWANVRENPHRMVKSNRDGVDRVMNSGGGYAFLMESSTNEYISSRECRTLMIPQLLDSKGYGIVTAKGSPLGQVINKGLMTLHEDGTLQVLFSKWWKPTSACSAIQQGGKKTKELYNSSMTLSDVAGVFYLLIVGALLTFLVALGEILHSRRTGRGGIHRVALTSVNTKGENDQLNGEGAAG